MRSDVTNPLDLADGFAAAVPAAERSPAAPADSDQTRWLAPASAVAVIALGRALQIASGTLTPVALLWLSVALAIVVAAVAVRRPLRWAAIDGRVVSIVAVIGILVQVGQLYTSNPGWFVRLDPPFLALFHGSLAALTAIGAALAYGQSKRMTTLLVAALVVVHFVIGAAVIRNSRRPPIDVDIFQRQAIRALLRGTNPYTMTFPNIYGHEAFYAPGASVGGWLQFGFPYPPMSLFASLPADVIARDHRYAALVAMELAAILMALARTTGFGPLAAALYLTTPRIFYVLEMSWTEPLLVLGLAGVVFAACRHPRARYRGYSAPSLP